MDADLLTWIFLGGGLLLMLLELALPGGVALFLGFSGITVGMLRFLGLISSTGASIAVWLVLSVVLTIAIRPFIKKYLKPESYFKYADEDYEAMDQIVEVIEEINEDNNSGRIRLDGTSWKAKSLEGTIKAGEKVRIQYRENTTWIVESLGVKEPTNEQLKNRINN